METLTGDRAPETWVEKLARRDLLDHRSALPFEQLANLCDVLVAAARHVDDDVLTGEVQPGDLKVFELILTS